MVSREKSRNGLGSIGTLRSFTSGTLIKDGTKGHRNHFWDFLLLNRDKIARPLWSVLNFVVFFFFFLIVKRKIPRITFSPFTFGKLRITFMPNQVSWVRKEPLELTCVPGKFSFTSWIAPTIRSFLGPAVKNQPKRFGRDSWKALLVVLPDRVKPSPSNILLLILICLIREFSSWNLSLFLFHIKSISLGKKTDSLGTCWVRVITHLLSLSLSLSFFCALFCF